MGTAFIERRLAIPKRSRIAPENGVLRMPFFVFVILRLIPGTVVSGIDNQSVFAQTELVQLVEQTARFVIKFFDDSSVKIITRFLLKLWGSIDNGVHHCVRKIEKERLFRIALNL